jgi:hypothetical protein
LSYIGKILNGLVGAKVGLISEQPSSCSRSRLSPKISITYKSQIPGQDPDRVICEVYSGQPAVFLLNCLQAAWWGKRGKWGMVLARWGKKGLLWLGVRWGKKRLVGRGAKDICSGKGLEIWLEN